ncbi:GumC family protein [Flavilitoribacter nigricans]|uniref:non-specific protein-tyrosine kinase n=1 Tax=Flavilitoribacter nigricans (strain ATCC 23147 / DSM 23189 / NBRC 102662 / NCIMB 1420 / SS-2) TaxID=1122177 RepID=A0A2D0NJH5_FLAN2|nr:tyrosine-protein kinase [Flavilitoribacter nigricans]PHN08607.1 hypothetical protein CRP01_01460 [Flavilitoribacter nigricans DSM 23189 = NBRC 102662]
MADPTIKNRSSFSEDVILIDLQKWLRKILSYWWLFVLCLVIAIAAGKLYLRYTTNKYAARAILLIKDAGRSGIMSEQSILFADDASSIGSKAMDNEIQILKSLTLMEKVVDRLDIEVSYFRKGNIKEAELYLSSPFLLESYQLTKPMEFGFSFFIELDGYDSFTLKFSEEAEEGKRHAFGVPFENKYGKFLIRYNSEIAIIPGAYRMLIAPVEYTGKVYSSKLQVRRIGDQSTSSVLELSILDEVPEKGRDVLNTLIDVYNEEEIRDENKVLRNTLNFIDRRVSNLLTELDSIEGGVQNFKSANSIITADASSSLSFTLDEIRASLRDLSDYEIERDILNSLERFLENDKMAFDLIPANLIAENQVLSGLVNQYNDMVLRRTGMLATASEINPARVALEEQISDIRALIMETIRNLQNDLQIPINKLENNIQDLRQRMGSIPGVEKRLVEKLRTQTIKENLFLYLLQKREETALSEAITTAKTRTIDRARASKGPVYPQRKLIMVSSVFLGLLVPLLFIIIRSFFEVKVDSEETIKSLTTIPILGRVAQHKSKNPIVVEQGSRTAINEMFRLVRANLNFANMNKAQQTIMITSSISGEGKTFMALNLGIAIALSGQKVLLIGMDLRKPKLGNALGGAASDHGLSNYLVGQSELEEIIRPYEGVDHLHYISSGVIPPNPTELLVSARMETLFSELKSQFDYILIDTPPITLVSDALLVRKFVDRTLVIVRHKHTRKTMLKNLDEMYRNEDLENVNIIFNGIKAGGRYGALENYQYGYGEGYYIDDK